MNTLFFDIASSKPIFTCCNSDSILSMVEREGRVGDHQLVELIDQVLADAKWEYADIDRLACVHGPGGFTSLRVAASAANTLMHQLQIPLAAIHLSDVYAARLCQPDALWVHSTKKTEVFVRGFGVWQNVQSEPSHMSLDTLAVLLTEGPDMPRKYIGELIPEHEQFLRNLSCQPREIQSLSAVLPAVLSQANYQNQIITPWYGRGG